MASKVVVSAKAVQDLQKRLVAHDRAIAREQQRRAEVVKRIEAMRTLLGASAGGRAAKAAEKPAEKVTVHRGAVSGAFVDRPAVRPSVPQAVEEALKKRGPLTAVEIRDAVTEAGVKREQLGATYSYLYTVLGRLEQRRRVVRVRGKYELVHMSAPVVIKPNAGELKIVGNTATLTVGHHER